MEIQCSKGWADRYAHSKSKRCQCECGGSNHGKKMSAVNSLRLKESVPEETGMFGQIVGYYPSRNVFFGGFKLDPADSQKFINHSPDGFNWGYGGSGPAQLALSILLHWFGENNSAQALYFYHDFKREVVALLPQGKNFSFPESKVKEWVESRKKHEEGI